MRKQLPGERQVKSFYFLYFAAAAAFLPYLALFYEHRGISGRQIGILTSIPPIITLFASSLWSGFADATQSHRRLLILAVGGTILSAFGVYYGSSFLMILPAVVIFALFNSPIIPLVDDTAMRVLKGEEQRYGKLRFWGAVGWGVSASLIGVLVDRYGLAWPLYGFVSILFFGLLTIFKLPQIGSISSDNYWKGFSKLMRNPQWVFFLMLIFTAGIGLSTIHHYLFLYMNYLGIGPVMMGLSLTTATVSELVVFGFADRMLVKWGIRNMLMVAVLILIVRLITYSLVSAAWAVLIIQLLHGLTFSLVLVAGVAYANRTAPVGLKATAQGIFSGVIMGLAAAIGALLGGWLYESLGAPLMYRWTGITITILMILIICVWFGFQRIRSGRRHSR